jgi:hypothetical protein
MCKRQIIRGIILLAIIAASGTISVFTILWFIGQIETAIQILVTVHNVLAGGIVK